MEVGAIITVVVGITVSMTKSRMSSVATVITWLKSVRNPSVKSTKQLTIVVNVTPRYCLQH